MPKSKSSRRSREVKVAQADTEPPPPMPDPGDDISKAISESLPSPELPENVVPLSPGRGRTPGPQKIGARRFFGGRVGQDPIVRAFVIVDSMEHGNRKLAREEWVKEYADFCSKPR
jgi:hypothetical protein